MALDEKLLYYTEVKNRKQPINTEFFMAALPEAGCNFSLRILVQTKKSK